VKDASATFTYKKSTIASVAIKNTTIARGDDVEYIVKDTAGNDITKDFPLSAFEVNSSDTAVVDPTNLEGKLVGKSIVVISVPDSAITTGNVVVTVNEATGLVLDTLQVRNNTANVADNIIYTSNAATTYKVFAEAKRANGSAAGTAKYTFISRNPSVAVVDTNAATSTNGVEATLTPVQAGTATIVVTAEVQGATVSKTIVVTVKEQAKLAGQKADKTTVVVDKAGLITDSLKITLLDQYNGTYKGTTNNSVALVYDKVGAEANATATNGTTAGAADPANGNKYTVNTTAVDGVATFVFTGVAKGNFTATAIITLPNGAKQTQRISVIVTDDAVTNGYVVEASNLKLDSLIHTDTTKNVGDANAAVKVFTKNSAGAKVAEVTTGITVNSQKTQDSILTIAGTTVTPIPGKAGKEVVNVAVNNVVVGTLAFEVDYSSENVINKVQVNKASIAVKNNETLLDVLFSSKTANTTGAITLIDKYGAAIDALVGTNVKILSSNGAIISDLGVIDPTKTGKVVLTIQIEGKVYTVNVNVTE